MTPRKSWRKWLTALIIFVWVGGNVAWLVAPTISGYYDKWNERQDAALAGRMTKRQAELEDQLREKHLPVFGIWEQVGPFNSHLAVVSPPERKPAPDATYRLLGGSSAGWQPMPQYVDGYPQSLRLKGIPPEMVAKNATVCLARTIVAAEATTIPAFLGCDGGFVLWLNGESMLLHDTDTGPMKPGQEMVQLSLQPGKNRLVLKIRLDRPPYQFFFQPEFGRQVTDELMTSLERQFPISLRRATGYRQRATESATTNEDQFYRFTEIPVSDGIFLEGGGLDFLPDGRLAVGTRRGFVYIVDGLLDEGLVNNVRFTQFADGLQEVLGLHVDSGGEIDVAQRGSLVRLRDDDHDGRADRFRSINNEWGLSGNYHEYTLDLTRDPRGNYYTSLCLSDTGEGVNASLATYRGWVIQITADGQFVPWCFGLRCANGLGWNANGDLFATDNQGQWVPACPVYHIQRNHYYGNPISKKLLNAESEEATHQANEPRTLPAVWIPYEEFCMSAADLVCDTTNGRFGPFRDQLFVGDMMKGTIIRVALERVNGEYQGACFLFRRGVGAVNRMTFGPDHRLYLTRASRGWGGAGRGEGLARLEFTGTTPLEIETVKLISDGFKLQFTLPLAPSAESQLGQIRLEQFQYEYWGEYGSPKVDREVLAVRAALSQDRRQLTLKMNGLKSAHVCHLALPKLISQDGQYLIHSDAFYTIRDFPLQ